MVALADARTALTVALSKIQNQRLDPSTTPGQLVALDDAVQQLEPLLEQIETAQLDEAANAVAEATGALQQVVDDARLDTLAQLKQELGDLSNQLENNASDLFVATKLGPADNVAQSASAGALPAPAAPAPAAPIGAAPINSSNFDDLSLEYQNLYSTCTITPGKESVVQSELDRLLAGRARYAGVAADTNGMPWYFVGIIHGMEAGYSFARHQHNGDPLTARTVNVPVGRPPNGQPSFSWEVSARDAILFKRFSVEIDFSVPHLLYLLEQFNGFGYRPKSVNSPYLWGCSNHYIAGKFIADHVYSATAVSNQVGSGVLIMELERQGLLN